jgi:ribosomal protein S18 acetylase RimI-like enzyme
MTRGTTALIVRAAAERDRDILQNFVAALQEFERGLRPSSRPGPAMAYEYVKTLIQRVQHQDGAIFLAETGNGPAGFLACYVDENVFETARAELVVSDLWVAPELRSRGVCTALIAAAQAHARGLGLSRLIVSSLSENDAAHAAYESLGFRRSLVTFERGVDASDDSSRSKDGVP